MGQLFRLRRWLIKIHWFESGVLEQGNMENIQGCVCWGPGLENTALHGHMAHLCSGWCSCCPEGGAYQILWRVRTQVAAAYKTDEVTLELNLLSSAPVSVNIQVSHFFWCCHSYMQRRLEPVTVLKTAPVESLSQLIYTNFAFGIQRLPVISSLNAVRVNDKLQPSSIIRGYWNNSVVLYLCSLINCWY